jgi:hypothetical protein
MCPHCKHPLCDDCKYHSNRERLALGCSHCGYWAKAFDWAEQLMLLRQEGPEEFFGERIAGHA